MGQIFGSMYTALFEDFFGLDLANYLWGQASPLMSNNMYIPIGMSMLVISLVMMTIYYYLVNHPRLCNLWGWGIFWLINGFINFLVGWQWVANHYYSGQMVEYVIQDGKQITQPLNIEMGDILCFGVSNMLLSLVAFILFSYALKWWSTNCSRAPF